MPENRTGANRSLALIVLPGDFSICRIEPSGEMPSLPLDSKEFWSLTQTTDELSLVCPEAHLKADLRAEPGWRVIKLEGPFAFNETGILSSVLSPLGQAGIGIFAISTFDTDYVLVKREALSRALTVLQDAGHRILQQS